MSDPLPLSALEHHAYCPRQCALILVDGLWEDNPHTVRGTRGHRRADSGADRRERGVQVVRSLLVWSDRLNLSGRADAVEFHDDGAIVPVEYKVGGRHGDTARVQICAQALCLEEMFSTDVSMGFVWYTAARRRDRVAIDVDLRELTVDRIEAVRKIKSETKLPPAPADSRCRECQFFGHCMPDLVANSDRTSRFLEEEVFACD